MASEMAAYVSTQRLYDAAQMEAYVEHGSGELREQHLNAGTDRVAWEYCDYASAAEFIAACVQRQQETGRRIQAYGTTVSYPRDQFDPENPDDIERAGELTYLALRAAHPDARILIQAHVDGKGSVEDPRPKLHFHTMVMNDCLSTGRAITKNRSVGSMRKVVNRVLKENGVRPKPLVPRPPWTIQRETIKDPVQLKMGDRFEAARIAANSVEEALALVNAQPDMEAELIEHTDADGSTRVGIHLGTLDDINDPGLRKNGTPRKRRWRHVQAGKLSGSFRVTELESYFADKRLARGVAASRWADAEAVEVASAAPERRRKARKTAPVQPAPSEASSAARSVDDLLAKLKAGTPDVSGRMAARARSEFEARQAVYAVQFHDADAPQPELAAESGEAHIEPQAVVEQAGPVHAGGTTDTLAVPAPVVGPTPGPVTPQLVLDPEPEPVEDALELSRNDPEPTPEPVAEPAPVSEALRRLRETNGLEKPKPTRKRPRSDAMDKLNQAINQPDEQRRGHDSGPEFG